MTSKPKALRRLLKATRRLRCSSSRQGSRVSQSVRRHLSRLSRRSRPISLDEIDRSAARSKGLPRPDFIIIGAPKCGTSWLQRALAQHPSILIVPDEIEYFSMHLDYPLKWYLNHFMRQLKASRRTSEVRPIVGEKSARYCSIPLESIRLVHRFLPDVKLILMTRDPVARHWAQAKRFFSKRRFNKLEGGVLAIPREDLFAFFERMRALSEYSSTIANWCEIFPPQQLLIVSQERTLLNPRATFDAVLQHLGAPLDYDPKAISLLAAQKNRGPKIEMPKDVAEFLEPMFIAERKYLQTLFRGRAAVYAGSKQHHVPAEA